MSKGEDEDKLLLEDVGEIDSSSSSVANAPPDASNIKTNTFEATSKSSSSLLRWDLALVLSVVVFPFIYTFQPSQSFLVQFLVDKLGLTRDQVDVDVLPAWTYSFLCFTLLFALLSQMNGKWCVVTGMFGACVTLVIICLLPIRAWGVALPLTVFSEVPQGVYSAGEVVYSSLLYRLVPLSVHFQHVTSVSRAMRLLGVLSSSLLAQLLLYFDVDVTVLFYISFGCLAVALLLSLALDFGSTQQKQQRTADGSVSSAAALWSTIKSSVLESWTLYHLEPVQQLSMFLFVSNGVHPLVLTYWQSLFRDIDPHMAHYNAFLFAACNALAFAGTLVPICCCGKGKRLSAVKPIIAVSPVLSCALLIVMSNVGSFAGSTIWPSYAVFLAYHLIYEVALVVANASLAQHLKLQQKERYGVLFCVSYSGSLVMQTILQLGLQQSSLTVRGYFVVFGGVYLVAPLVMAAIRGFHVLIERTRRRQVESVHVQC